MKLRAWEWVFYGIVTGILLAYGIVYAFLGRWADVVSSGVFLLFFVIVLVSSNLQNKRNKLLDEWEKSIREESATLDEALKKIGDCKDLTNTFVSKAVDECKEHFDSLLTDWLKSHGAVLVVQDIHSAFKDIKKKYKLE